MKHSTVSSILVFAMLIALTPVHAAEVEGIKYSDDYVAEGKNLKLTGTGLLRYWGFKAYTGALYLEEGATVGDVLSDKAKRIELEYFRATKGRDFRPATDKSIAKNVDAPTYARSRPQIEYHMIYKLRKKSGYRVIAAILQSKNSDRQPVDKGKFPKEYLSQQFSMASL